jgi:polysaccharide biosynthesis transport protein
VQLHDYLRIVRRGWRLIAASVGVCLLLGGLIIVMSESKYAATAELFVAPGSGPSTAELVQGSAFFADRVKTYAEIVDSAVVLEPVIEELGLNQSSRSLANSVSATAPLDTVLLRIRVTDTDPERAATVANAVATRFQTVATELETVEGSDEDPVVRVTVVQPATVPTVPISPNKRLILIFAAMIGLAIGFAIAVFREAMNKRIRSESDLRTLTDMPVVGKIPHKAKDERLLLIGDAARGLRAEAFRQLRTNLQYVDISGEHRTFVITSALPGEGKSITAANLALTIADAGTSVCLIEADLRRPRISRLLDLESEIGLTSIIIGNVAAETAVQRWGDTGVDVIAAGHLPPNPSELLSSRAMIDLLDHLQRAYDFVILDTPPLLAVTDAAILARRCGGAIVVVSNRGRRTVTREQLLEAFENLESAGTKVLGVVLNRLPSKGPDAIALSEYEYMARPMPTPRPPKTPPPAVDVGSPASRREDIASPPAPGS